MSPPCTALIDNNSELTSASDIANAFVRHFQTMYSRKDACAEFRHFDNAVASTELSGMTVDDSDIICSVNMIGNSKANLECCPVRILKLAIPVIAQPLAAIYSRMLHEGYVPAEFKCARVAALHKGGDRTDARNYRPISVVSFFSVFSRSLSVGN